MIRQILAVVAGFAVWTMLWLGANAAMKAMMPDVFLDDGSVDSTGFLALLVGFSIVFSFLAGFITASVSRHNEMKPVVALAVIQVAIGIVVEIAYWDVIPVWYHITFIGFLAPAILMGGKKGIGRKTAG